MRRWPEGGWAGDSDQTSSLSSDTQSWEELRALIQRLAHGNAADSGKGSE